MFETDPGPSRWKLLGPGWWVAGAALIAFVATVPRLSARAITFAGLAAAVAFLLAGEAWRRWQGSDPISVVRGQAWTGAAVAGAHARPSKIFGSRLPASASPVIRT